MAGDWLNWQQFYSANQPEAQRESQEEADKNGVAQREFEGAMSGAAKSGTVDPAAFAKQADASRGQMRQTGMSTPWENAVYGSPDTTLNYGDAWGQLGSRLAGVQAQQQSHERAQQQLTAMAKPKASSQLADFTDGLKKFYAENGMPFEDRGQAAREKQWGENNPYERRKGESYAEYSDRIARGG